MEPVPKRRPFSLSPYEAQLVQVDTQGGMNRMSILWIILIVILVLALLGFFSRGYW